MKKLLFYSSIVLLVINCQKESEIEPMSADESGTIQSESYIYKDSEYTLSYCQFGDGSTRLLETEDNKILLEVLEKPTVSILCLPDKVMLFDNSEESQEYLSNSTKTEDFKTKDFGIPVTPDIDVYCYQDIDFKGGLLYLNFANDNPSIGIYGLKNLSDNGWNDKISSIKGTLTFHQWIYFYEKKDYDGKSIGWANTPGYETTISESNLHKKIMRNYIIKKIYWGDQISSIRWRSLQ